MKSFAPLAIIVALVVAGLTPAAAQPGGTYLQTCNNVRQFGDQLEANCRTEAGSYRYSRLTLPCRGEVSNENGFLVCRAGGGGYRPGGGYNPGYGYIPGGSYQQTCRRARVEGGNVLRADCQATNGQYYNTALNLNRCRPGTDVANINARLECLYYR